MSRDTQSPSTQPADLTPSLVARLRRGDTTAGGLLEELYRRAMVRFCRGYLGNAEEAEDAVQEVFFRVLRAEKVPDNFRAWLYKIARNYCISVLRARARRHDRQDLPPASRISAGQTGNLTRVIKQELRAQLVHLVNALPQIQREVLILRYGEELSRAEIAYVLDIPESLVKSRLFEGLKKLREHTSLLEDHP
ncbi:MAG: RNA polymerase sigma factor [Phycisphaerae bacterium]|nr:RNA polymerase sigma factor [Phycisphaerae bacterium]